MKKEVYIKSLRQFRIYHKYISLTLLLLLLIISITGILLAWKKDVALLQPPSQKGISENIADWMPMANIATIAEEALTTAHPSEKDNKISKMDARPSKGIVKVIFKEHSWEVQVDATNGDVKSIAKRHSDWIESLHDGSIVSDAFKLITMNLTGIGVVFLTITGFWMWYAPRKVRELKRRKH